MDNKKQEKNNGYYACCPLCKTMLIQAHNGLNGLIKCSQCGAFIRVIIENNKVTTTQKE